MESLPTSEPGIDRADPKGLARLAQRYMQWMGTMNYSSGTIRLRTIQLKFFLNWCAERNLARPRQVTRRVLERYIKEVAKARVSGTKRRLTTGAQHGRLVAVRCFFKWLARKKLIPHNPASEIDLPQMERRLPKNVLSHEQVERVLELPDPSTPLGLRDRAILETFYSTGLRRAELLTVRVDELYIERGFLLVNQGKGKKDRVVPIGARAVHWIQRYLEEVRPTQVRRKVRHHLFLTARGSQFSASALGNLVKDYLLKAGIKGRGACHMFRHSMATSMLENGAGIRFIQEMLGHADLKTTQIYTHVSPVRLQEVHTATHPAKLAG
ncbi:MAG: site-specific tyrosine recombinase XerC [Planctomycetes bacterium]|nr:site-specific tyrosine recombinase XerC [Planctomycetota bacterium]